MVEGAGNEMTREREGKREFCLFTLLPYHVLFRVCLVAVFRGVFLFFCFVCA